MFTCDQRAFLEKVEHKMSIAEIAKYLDKTPKEVEKEYSIMLKEKEIIEEKSEETERKGPDVITGYSLVNLNDILFNQLKKLNNSNLSECEFKTEVERSKAINSTAQVIINNCKLMIDARTKQR